MPTPFATCSCGATYDQSQLARLSACLACEEPFFEPPAPIDLPALRQAVFYALEQSNGGVALELLSVQVPQVLDVIDELADVLEALMGRAPCRCAESVVIGGKPNRRTPCPHVTGALALARAGRRPVAPAAAVPAPTKTRRR